ncbi:transglutaminase domain-containing protein [Ruminococcus sp.]|uniref:transglutaminase domain-containing protein n=1 Tax=Ruminococcus sp. TaxID=41978 RepID=UPI0025D24D0A|nr:transglutaminase domain-containing protein [Ruminococcus sp.]MBQ8965684.1 transglutaminase [Ruminococcus sp.]
MAKKLGAALMALALLLAAAGGGYYAYKALEKDRTLVSSSDEGTVVTRKSKVVVPSGGSEIVVEEDVSAEDEAEIPISDEEAAEVELPFAVDYFADDLTPDEQIICRQIYKGMVGREEKINIKKDVIDSEDVCQLIVMIVTGSPEIDYVDSDYSVQVDANGCASAIFMNYTRSAEDSEMRRTLTQQAIDRICAEITPNWTDFQKFKLVHDALVNNCVYYEADSDCYTAYGCLVGGNAVCEGYSKALMLLCDRVDINCLPVIGQGLNEDGTSQGHIWNKVMLNGHWYSTDVTWDDPVFDSAENYLRYDYFSVTDEEMERNHIEDENKYIAEPECTSTELDYYRYYGYYAESADDAELAFSRAIRDAMAGGEEYARIKCADRQAFDDTLDWVFGDGAGNTALFEMIKDGAEKHKEYGYDETGYSVINNAITYNISIRLRK